jgi:Sec-independent protein translocase protein TatA
MYLSIGQIVLLALVFFLFFGNFDKLNDLLVKLKSSFNKEEEKKEKNIEE